jgi:hypothetical protein
MFGCFEFYMSPHLNPLAMGEEIMAEYTAAKAVPFFQRGTERQIKDEYNVFANFALPEWSR